MIKVPKLPKASDRKAPVAEAKAPAPKAKAPTPRAPRPRKPRDKKPAPAAECRQDVPQPQPLPEPWRTPTMFVLDGPVTHERLTDLTGKLLLEMARAGFDWTEEQQWEFAWKTQLLLVGTKDMAHYDAADTERVEKYLVEAEKRILEGLARLPLHVSRKLVQKLNLPVTVEATSQEVLDDLAEDCTRCKKTECPNHPAHDKPSPSTTDKSLN
jgi:hypothetical protein